MPKIDEKTGNAILVCSRKGCGREVDKGCPPIEGQDDSSFVCEPCHDEDNRKGLEARIQTDEIA